VPRRFASDRLVVATHNAGKAAELAALLAPYRVRIVSHGELGLPIPDETGTTFLDNAELKARAAAASTGLPALADDSGIGVEALGGQPGIHTADWGGPGRDWLLAMQRVQEELDRRGVPATAEARRAAFICALALCWPDGHCERFLGRMPGHVTWPPRGVFGHGYDPMFVPEGHGLTFAEMTPEAKNAVSHRADAFRQLVAACFA
jgi:XTP/dITP diphosphohydrolase